MVLHFNKILHNSISGYVPLEPYLLKYLAGTLLNHLSKAKQSIALNLDYKITTTDGEETFNKEEPAKYRKWYKDIFHSQSWKFVLLFGPVVGCALL